MKILIACEESQEVCKAFRALGFEAYSCDLQECSGGKPEYGIYFECYGGNDNGGENSKNFDLGDAYKGATTDALTKIGSYLEIGIDVFKGLNTAPAPQQQFKKWLNITDSNGSDTKEWLNVITAINEKKITSIAEVKKYYNLSKEVEQKINELWK